MKWMLLGLTTILIAGCSGVTFHVEECRDVESRAPCAVLSSIINQTELWLGTTVGADAEMTPRTRIVSVGYSYRVGTVDGARGGAILGDVIVTGKANIGTTLE